MKINTFLVLVALSILNFVGTAPGAILNVPEDYQTIQAGIDAASSGDTVLVHPGTYDENLYINQNNLTVGSLALTTGNLDYVEETIIDGGQRGPVVLIYGGNGNTLLGFTIQNGAVGYQWNNYGYGGGVSGFSTSELLLKDLVVQNNSAFYGGGIGIFQWSATIRNVLVINNRAVYGGGIDIHGSWVSMNSVTVAHNSIRQEPGYGGGEGGGLFFGNTQAAAGHENVDIFNSIFWANEGDGDVADDEIRGGYTTVHYSDVQGGEEGNAGLGWAEGNIDEDPDFVDAENGDFHLADGSPCIDTGDPLAQDEPDGSPADMGAYNFSSEWVDHHDYVLDVPEEYGTIQWAIQNALPGDTILVQPGTYYENLQLYQTSANITIASLALTTGDLSYVAETVIDAGRNGPCLFSYGGYGDGVVLSGFTLQNGIGTSWDQFLQGGALFSLNSTDITYENLVIQNNTATHGGAISVVGGSATMRNILAVKNSAQWGFGIHVSGAAATMDHLTVADNCYRFIGNYYAFTTGALYLNSGDMTVTNSIIQDNDYLQIRAVVDEVDGNGNDIAITYNDIEGGSNSVKGWYNEIVDISGNGNIDEDARFRDAYEGDYRLDNDSPCIDAGDPDSPEDADGSRADIGAHDLVGGRATHYHGGYQCGWPVNAAQPDTFETNTYGGNGNEDANSLIEAEDGGFAIAGYTTSAGAGGQDFYLLKTDAEGDSVWSRTYGGADDEIARQVIQTEDGGYLMVGSTRSFGEGEGDFFLVRTNSEGEELWSKTYGGTEDEAAHSVVQTADGGFAVAGWTNSFDDDHDWNNHDFWLVRTDANGDSIWARRYGGTITDAATKIISTADGGFTMVGPSNSFGDGDYDAWMIHIAADGDSLWSKTIGVAGYYDYANDVIQMEDEGYALAGVSGLGDATNGYLARTDAQGELLWQNTYGNPDVFDSFSSLVGMADGGFVLTGSTTPLGNGDVDFWLLRVNYGGQGHWQRSIDIDGADEAHALVQTRSSGFAYTGSVVRQAGHSDIGFVITSPEFLDSYDNVTPNPGSFDFGWVPYGQGAATNIVFRNEGPGNSQIRVWWDAGVFSSHDALHVIQDGDSSSVEIRVASETEIGDYYGTLYWTAECDAVQSIPLHIRIYEGGGEEEPPLEVDVDSLDFGVIPPGQQAVRRVRFHNPTGDTLRMRARIVGGGGGMYACPEDSEYVVPPGGSVSVIVKFNVGGGGGAGGYPDTLAWRVGGGGTEWRIPIEGSIGGGGGWITTVGDGGSGGGGGLVKTPIGFAYGGSYGPTERTKKFWAGGVDSRGRPIWGRPYGGPGGKAKPIIKRRGGGYALGGTVDTLDEGGGSDWLVVLDENGDSLWSRACGCHPRNTRITGIGETPEGDLILIGDFTSDGPDGDDIFIDKVTSDGGDVWSHTFGGPGDDDATAIIPSPDGGLVVIGTTRSPDRDDTDIWVIKLDPDGDPSWSKTYGGPSDEMATGATPNPIDSCIVITGNLVDVGNGIEDIILLKITPDGDSLWTETLGGPLSEKCNSVAPTLDGGFILTGTTVPDGGTLPDVLLIRTDENGDSLWSQSFGGNLKDVGTAVVPDLDGGFVIAGETSSFGPGESNILLFKVVPDSGAASSITASPDSVGFGRVCFGLGAERVVRFTNEGNRILRVTTLIDHDELFYSPKQVHTILPGEHVNVVVSIPPHAPIEGGLYLCHLVWYVTPDDPQSIPLTATLRATAVPEHFTGIIETGDSHSVLVTEATIDSEPIMPGWEIGVYTPDGLLAGAGVKLQGILVGVPAWGDDPETDDVDGFRDGEPMTFRIWDADINIEYATRATIEEGSINWRADGVTALTLEAVQSRTIEVAFVNNWNLISINVIPPMSLWICETGPDIELMMEQFIDAESGQNHVLLVKDEHGRFYWPSRGYNGIPYWNLTEGYQVKVDQALHGSWSGEPIPATADIPIARGWNYIAYYPSYELSASSPDFKVLSPILEHVILAKNRSGNFMRPASNFSNMAPWRETMGYQIKVDANVVLNYPLEPDEGDLAAIVPASPDLARATHWNACIETGVNMSVLITEFKGAKVEAGDQVAAFNSSDNLVGIGTVQEGGICGLAVWGDDISTEIVDGLGAGEAFELRLWSVRAEAEFDLNEVREKSMLVYETDTFLDMVAKVTAEIPDNFYIGQNYPNPFNSVTRVAFGLPEASIVTISIFDLSGRKMSILTKGEFQAGHHSIVLNGESMVSGVYIVKMEATNFSAVRKVMLVK